MIRMTEAEQATHLKTCIIVREAVAQLERIRCEDEDVQVALARLKNWLTENDGRWVR